MPESRHHEARGEQIIAVGFQTKAPVDEVSARLLELQEEMVAGPSGKLVTPSSSTA